MRGMYSVLLTFISIPFRSLSWYVIESLFLVAYHRSVRVARLLQCSLVRGTRVLRRTSTTMKLPLVTIIFVLIMLVLVVSYVLIVVWTVILRAPEAILPKDSAGTQNARYIYLLMSVMNIDPVENGGTLTVHWSVRSDTCTAGLSLETMQDLEQSCPSVNIYTDPYASLRLLLSLTNIWIFRNLFAGALNPVNTETITVPTEPLAQIDSASIMLNPHADIPVFKTDLGVWWLHGRNMLMYPFDRSSSPL